MDWRRAELIGVMADSHDEMDQLEKAVTFFNDQDVDLVLHAGDFISPLTLEPLSELEGPLVGVFGNNDGDKLLLRERVQGENIGKIEGSPFQFDLEAGNVVLAHRPRTLEALVKSPQPDLIVYGHTHQKDIREGSPLVINPGEVGGWVTGISSVGLVDMAKGRLEIVAL